MKSKKANIFSIMLMIATLILLVLMTVIFFGKESSFERTLGENAIGVLTADIKAEKALLYTHESAGLAARQALYDLAKDGGKKEKDCGDYIGYTLWNNASLFCTPQNPEIGLYSKLDHELSKLFVEYSGVLPVANYEYSIDGGNLTGKAKEPLKVELE